ncbi:uncharacterized protein LOC125520709 [Triticum urartu]|uniref:uncharacterized protein LOC125520709 n=1 Tax=Triticum urartu TaxID=4572 RepID=UPI0020440BD4|nr:uncharacterized protein LOC125520709 [Triticum urartu]
MAELASGAVSSLLGVIRNEAQLLGRVRQDAQFIREEMESMKSFLAHLERMAPEGGDYDELIRPWMKQVRLLARDCNNCIDLYLSRSSRDIHRARGGLRRFAWWFPWFMQMMAAQHRTAIKLRALRDRVRDVGERRLRYNVELPASWAGAGQLPAGTELAVAASLLPPMHVAASYTAWGGNEEDGDDTVAVYHSVPRRAFFQPPTPEDNVRAKLSDWIQNVAQGNLYHEKSIPSVAVVAPDKEETLAIAIEALAICHYTGMRGIVVNIPLVHFYFQTLRTEDILFYVLRELQSAESQRQQLEGQVLGEEEQHIVNLRKNVIISEKMKLIKNITEDIQGMKVDIQNKLSEIKYTIEQMKGGQLQLDLEQMSHDQLDLMESAKDEPLGVLLRALWVLKLKQVEGAPATKQNQERKGAARPHEDIIKETAKKLKEHMEDEAPAKLKLRQHIEYEECASTICLKEAQYEHILREVFPPVTNKKPPQTREQATAVSVTGPIILVEDQFKQMIRKILQELQDEKYVKEPDTAEPREGTTSQGCNPEAITKEAMKIGEIHWKINEQLKIKGIMDRINGCLMRMGPHYPPILVILKLDHDYVSGWEETRNAFSWMGCIAGALMLTTTVNTSRAKEYCYPSRDPIDHSLLGLYRDIVLELTNRRTSQDSPNIFLDILEKCKSHEFCMKIFVHALCANPKRSNEELTRFNITLQALENSSEDIYMKMLMFCYKDLPKEYKSCLLYLAIFPQRQSIRRSTLIGRWISEGLITKEFWPSSVHRANRCFEVLLDRWLVYPSDIGDSGQVKSCIVGDRVHRFITKVARKQQIIERRVSHHLARHFSIVNDLELRSSDTIQTFFEKLPEESSGASLIKVLDLEGCRCFGEKNQRYLKHICRTMLLLKFLSLRQTDVTQLPSEINNLRELEVLDIRHTNVHESAIVNVLLLKLKCLLAGPIVPSSEPASTKICYVPNKIGKMLNLEVLSNVKARNHQVLKDIGKLWQLRKLGVVIEDNDKLIRNLLRAISDLHVCLKSLSITLPMTEQDPSYEDFSSTGLNYYKQPPKLLLESLSITGTTKKVQLLQQLTKQNDFFQLAKITLTGTRLKQDDLTVLSQFPNIVCLRLRDKAYIDDNLTIKNEEFKNLKCFLVEGSNMTGIFFEGGAVKLEKIILCSTDGLQSLTRVEDLPELKEVEMNNNNKLSLFDKAERVSKVTLCGTKLSKDDLKMFAKIRYMRCLVLKEKACVENEVMFYKDEFPRLNLLIVDGSAISKIEFASGSAPKLEKIIWSFTRGMVGSLSGIGNLPKLKELEFNGDLIPDELKEAINKHKNKPNLIYNKQENQ